MTKLPNISEAIGKNIRNARLFRRLTTKELAELSGLSPGHLQMLETGRRRINVDHLFAIAEALGLPPEKLINPDITAYFPSQRTLPLVNMATLDDFSDCPDFDSVGEVADEICLCPPEVAKSPYYYLAFAIEFDSKSRIPPGEASGIIVVVPSNIDEIPYGDWAPPAPEEPEDLGPFDIWEEQHLIRFLVKITGHPVCYRSVIKWRSQGRTFLTVYSFTDFPRFRPIVTAACDKQSEPSVEWICRSLHHYPREIAQSIKARKRPRKEK